MIKLPILFLSALLTTAVINGCSMTGAKQTAQREWIEVNCNGFADWTTCNDKASRFCPGGYDVSGREENLVIQRRVMTLACKK